MYKCLRMASVIFGNVNYMVNLDGNLDWKISLEKQLEIQMEILILGILDPWKFSMEVYFGNLDWKFSWKFRQKFRWNF